MMFKKLTPLLMVVILICTSCKTGFIASPQINKTIYKELGGSSGPNEIHYYCYFDILNFRQDVQLMTPAPVQHLVLVDPAGFPISVAANTSKKIKFEITGIDPTACTAPCQIDAFTWTGQYSGSVYTQTGEVDGSGSPVTQAGTWIFTDGDPNTLYHGQLSVNYQPNVAGGGMQYKWPQIGDVYNPNDFDIEILTDKLAPPAFDCLFNGTGDDQWTLVKSHQSVHYGQMIRDRYKGSCLPLNPDAFIRIRSQSGRYSPNNQGAVAIRILVTII